MTFDGGWYFGYGATDITNAGNIKIIGAGCRIYPYTRNVVWSGNVSGNSTVDFDPASSAATVTLIGEISPGTSIGTMTIIEDGSGALYIGDASDKVTLNIEMELDSTDSDKLVIRNLDNPLVLSNIDLNINVRQPSDPSKTNTILSLINGSGFDGFFNSTNWSNVTYGSVFIDGDDIKVTNITPEPVLFTIYYLSIIICYLRKIFNK